MGKISTVSTNFQYSKLLHTLAFLILAMSKNDENASKGLLANGANALRVQGEFDLRQDFFIFLAKFGFQKTEIRDPNNTQGVIYGNITVSPENMMYNSQQQQQSLDNATEGDNSGDYLYIILYG